MDLHPSIKVNIFWEWYFEERKKVELAQQKKEAVSEVIPNVDSEGISELTTDDLDDIYEEATNDL